MMTVPIIRFLNIILAALLAGISLGIWIGFNPLDLSPSTYVEQQQNMLEALRVTMVLLVLIATIVTFLSAYLQRKDKSTCFTLTVAAAFFIACILVTRFGNKPIDDLVMTWTPNSLPNNWTSLRDSWWSLHKIRTITELVALVLITWTSVRK
jgi:hypothetical protein